MSGLSPAFEDALSVLFARLGEAAGTGPLRPRLEERAHVAKVERGEVLVPVRFEVHWRRFETIPTDLVRDAAYAAALAGGHQDEAEAQVFAAAFVRDHVLNAD